MKMKLLAFLFSMTAGFVVAGAAHAETQSKPYEFKPEPDKPVVLKAQAFADREGITPGETFNILISLKIQDGWHVYWSNYGVTGMTGMPTEVALTLPKGFESGRTRFPIPEAHYNKELKETTWQLPEEALLVTAIKAPSGLKAGESIKIEANVSWLACKGSCIPGNTEPALTINLPVLAAGAKGKPAHEKLFEAAAEAFPTPGSAAKHVKLSGKTEPAKAKPGGKLTAILDVEIADKMHMQANKPLQDFMIPAILFVDRTEGLDINEVEYPNPHTREDKILGKLSEYAGKVTFKIPIDVDEEATKDGRWVRGVFQYQICADNGTCFPPEHVAFEIPVQMEGGEKPKGNAAVVAVSPTDGAQADAAHSNSSAQAGEAEAASDVGWFNRVQNKLLGMGFFGTLLLAAIGGLVLNFMPCVLPVISLKVLSFVRQAKENRGRIFVLGLAYCSGIMVFFGVVAWLYYGTGSGWGEHFQNPVVILILAGLVTAFALSLFGVFTVFTPQFVNELGQKAEEREGVSSAFFTGILATVLGTACTAPFLSAAVGVASKYPANQGAWIFIAVGAGMASPFVLLSAFPAWLKFIPRPGKWMEAFEAVMGFLLLGTVVWLMSPLGALIGAWGVVLAIIWLLGLSLAVWVKGRIKYGDALARKTAINGIALGILLIAWCVPFRWWYNIDKLESQVAEHERLYRLGITTELTGANQGASVTWGPEKWKNDETIPWVPYDQALVRDFVNAGYPVFVDFTAEWCQSCKTNKASSIDTIEIRELLRSLNAVPFEADYTRKQPWMRKVMESYGRASVPVYLVFSPGNPDKPEILREILTPGIVAEALRNAGPSKPVKLAGP